MRLMKWILVLFPSSSGLMSTLIVEDSNQDKAIIHPDLSQIEALNGVDSSKNVVFQSTPLFVVLKQHLFPIVNNQGYQHSSPEH